MKKLLLSAAVVLGAILSVNAQYYNLNFTSAPGNPGGVNTDIDFNASSLAPPAGSTTILNDIPHASSAPQYSAAQTLPFVFDFNGGPVTTFRANSSGYLTFSKKAVLTNAGNTPASLPSGLLPDSSVCTWGLCLAGLSGGTCVYTKVYGTAPHRQLWIDWFAATNPADTCAINWWGIVLEEGTNNIYMVDQAGGWYWNGCSSPPLPGLTVGVQISPTSSFQVAGSPSINSIAVSNGNADNNYYEFSPGAAPAYAANVMTSNLSTSITYYKVGSAYPINATIANIGSTGLTGLTLNWSVDGGSANQTVASPTIAAPNPVSTAVVASSINWTPASVGAHTIKIWATQLNGSHANTDLNDTLTIKNLIAYDSVEAKAVMFEEFSCASCDPCLYAMTNIDTVSENNAAICNTVRYHWYFPGEDMINQETATLVNSRFETYYGQSGVPDAQIDGATYYPGYPQLTSSVIQAEAAEGSPFKISVTQATYDPTTKKFWCTAVIKSFGAFAAGLTAQVVLTEDSVNFTKDQSTEDPQNYFAPPIGTGAGNDDPDWMYPLVLKFPDAVENMLPSVNGTTLAAFTPESTQTVTVSWTQDHPWAAQRATWPYDSTLTQHFTVFVQTNSAIGAIPAQYVFQSKRVLIKQTTGVANLSEGVSFEVYPNPTNSDANISFSLVKDQNVTVEVYNTLGQNVYSQNEGTMGSGQHLITVPGNGLKSGVYFVRVTTEDGTSTQKLVIQK